LSARLVEKEEFAALVLRLRAEGVSDKDLLTCGRADATLAVRTAAIFRSRPIPPHVPIDCGSFIEGVDFAVRVLHSLKVKPGQRVLEVGTGSGFMTAVIARMAERVLTIDRYKTLTTNAQKRLETLGIRNVIVRQADGSAGLQGEGTFDRILVTAAFENMPRFYADQLVSGGSMIAPLDDFRNRMSSCAPDEDRQPLRAGRAFQLPIPADCSTRRFAALSETRAMVSDLLKKIALNPLP
jgi:protein-L-isoaspartate(D-aspartate) O-methyltransferase